jgi:deoxycytidylate deaminase/diadenosine tetraphosphate (Ap4A) HIT family hydrolase
MTDMTPEEQQKQEAYRDARFTKKYDGIWQNVGKCVFCDLRDKYVIYKENGIALTITLFAYIDGHMMILPTRHVGSPKELTPLEWETVRKFMYLAKKIIKKTHGIKGIQFVQKDGSDAQSTVTDHLHYHAVPFDSPDLTVWNYRKLAYTPLENANLYKKLSEKITELSGKYDKKYADGASEETTTPFSLSWGDVAFGSKKSINSLEATFILAPREMSPERFTQLVKAYLPKSNIVLGLAKEEYVDGFEGQAQFRTLQATTVQKIIDKVNDSKSPHKIYTLSYFQREAKYILDKLQFARIVLINGSWHKSFHIREEYYIIANRQIPYEFTSPFASEQEARDYEAHITKEWGKEKLPNSSLSEAEMMHTAAASSKKSYDYSFQTGVALGRQTKNGYKLLATGFNKVVPFQTFALHYGAAREQHYSPPHDLNHYDTIHAEVDTILKVQKQGIDLKDATLFINLLPCPSCARMFCETDIAEFVYAHDHSDGYAITLLEKAGKKVRRLVPHE